MRTPVFQLRDLRNAFRNKKVLTKQELLQATQCSNMTAWRLLQRHGYFTVNNRRKRGEMGAASRARPRRR